MIVVPMIISAYSISKEVICEASLLADLAKSSMAAIEFFTYRGIKSENTRDTMVISIPSSKWYLYLKKYLRICFRCAIGLNSQSKCKSKNNLSISQFVD